MDSASMISRPFSSSGCCSADRLKELRISPKSVVAGGRNLCANFKIRASRFEDSGHLQYYESKNCGTVSENGEKIVTNSSVKKMKKKKQLKLLKGLSKDLSTFYQMGFGLDFDGALVDQVKANTISDAAEVLLQQLQKLRSEEKRKKKEEKAKMKVKHADCEVSSSSESSDSDCGEIIQMGRHKQVQNVLHQPPIVTPSSINPITEKQVYPSTTSLVNTPKIEVCMGGKCKKSGGAALLDEFQKAVGIEGAVCGCKCMGKCREGPNVKVLNDNTDAKVSNGVGPLSSLCIGVGLEDVERIVANFLGGNKDRLGFALS